MTLGELGAVDMLLHRRFYLKLSIRILSAQHCIKETDASHKCSPWNIFIFFLYIRG